MLFDEILRFRVFQMFIFRPLVGTSLCGRIRVIRVFLAWWWREEARYYASGRQGDVTVEEGRQSDEARANDTNIDFERSKLY